MSRSSAVFAPSPTLLALLISVVLGACAPDAGSIALVVEMSGSGQGRVLLGLCPLPAREPERWTNGCRGRGYCDLLGLARGEVGEIRSTTQVTSVQAAVRYCLRAAPSEGSIFEEFSGNCDRVTNAHETTFYVESWLRSAQEFTCRARFGLRAPTVDGGAPDAAAPMDVATPDRADAPVADGPRADDRLDVGPVTPLDAPPPRDVVDVLDAALDAARPMDAARDTMVDLPDIGTCTRPEADVVDAGPPPDRGPIGPCARPGTSCPSPFTCTPQGTCLAASSNEVLVPATTFWRGCNDANVPSVVDYCDRGGYPQHQVTLSRYAIDRTEVTVHDWRVCVASGGCSPPANTTGTAYDDPCTQRHPVTWVTRAQAQGYCARAGKRLCTEAEWELAARGGCETITGTCRTGMGEYPWGNQRLAPTEWCTFGTFSGCSSCFSGICSEDVGRHPRGDSPYGAQDMLGNVAEWVSDWNSPYTESPQVDPRGPATTEDNTGLIRGGSNATGPETTSLRGFWPVSTGPEGAGGYIGFRCCRSVPEGTAMPGDGGVSDGSTDAPRDVAADASPPSCAVRAMAGACTPSVDAGCDIVDVAIGGGVDGTVCAVFSGGTVRCWSRAISGLPALGNGARAYCYWPGLVTTLTGVERIFQGNDLTCVIRAGSPRSVWCWGSYAGGTFGGPASGDALTPVIAPRIPTPDPPGTLVLGGRTGFSISAAGVVTAWGRNPYGQFGSGSFEAAGSTAGVTPTVVSLPALQQLALHPSLGSTACGVFAGGSVRCWGVGADNLFGTAITPVTIDTQSATPVTVPGITDARAVRVAGRLACALRNDQTLWCWGGSNSGTTMRGAGPSPSQVLDRVAQVEMSATVTCALRTDGTVWCWGDGNSVGNGAGVGTVAEPEQVRGLSGVRRLYMGEGTRCAWRGGADLRCWGFAAGVSDGLGSGVPVVIRW